MKSDRLPGVFVDLASNRKRYKIQLCLMLFRLTQLWMGNLRQPRKSSYPMVAIYRFVSEWVFCMEIRPTTSIGAPLVIHHGFGIVINPGAILGNGVTLRNGVVIGNKGIDGSVPVLGDKVEVGANAVILGGVVIGSNSTIGAAAVVTKDVPAGSVVAGNPAKEIRR